MTVRVHYFTDPACSASWTTEPAVRKLMVDFGDSLSWTWVMGGLARDFLRDANGNANPHAHQELLLEWLEAADGGQMPIDPRLWTEGPISSSFPACMAVKAAAEQASDGGYRYLRALREGLFCFRRKLDTTEALVEEARGAGLNVERFRVDLGSHAIVEAFGADLERTRTLPPDARERGGAKLAQGGERVVFPTAVFSGEDGAAHAVYGPRPYEEYRDAALAAGATRAVGDPPGVLDAIDRFGRMAPRELELVCDLPGPRARAELWRLALDWKLRPIRVLTGFLWETA
ncbi:MAG TPA: DsbA family protein [Thermoleophilaceae bacterium]|nr:DsbA family protein [Thermoleophilaceae bacterium]